MAVTRSNYPDASANERVGTALRALANPTLASDSGHRDSALEAALQKRETLDTDTFNRIVERFLERARTMPYYVEYCSLTGKFCEGAEKIQKACLH